jgi:signal transduction histidine kinase
MNQMNTNILSLQQGLRNNKIVIFLSIGFFTIIFILGLKSVVEMPYLNMIYFSIAAIAALLMAIVAAYIGRLEKALKEQKREKEFTNNVLETIDEGFVVVDRNFRIVAANKAYYAHIQMHGDNSTGQFIRAGKAGIKTRHCFEISHGLGKPCYEAGEECAVKKAFETGEPCTVVHKHNDRQGKPLYVEVKSYPMEDDDGMVSHVIETLQDITEKVKSENRIILDKKMEALTCLTGGVAHNFNNLLAAVVCYGSLLKMKMKYDAPALEYVEKILEVSGKASNLTRNLLAYGSNNFMKPGPVRINDIVKQMHYLIDETIGENIELKLALTETDFIALADMEQIEKLLLHLVHNAKEAMCDGGRLTIETGMTELNNRYIESRGYGKPGKYACISVMDTGKGINEKIKERIYEPFFTTKEVGKGPGLGLAAAYGIVKQHNGHIDFNSEEGKGTVFHIYLPVIAFENEDVSRLVFEAA